MSVFDICVDKNNIYCDEDWKILSAPDNFKSINKVDLNDKYFNILPFEQAKHKLKSDIQVEIACRKNLEKQYKEAMELIGNLQNELKAIKNKEDITEIVKGKKIITFNRITNKITWRYWYADLDWDIVEELMKNELINYYKTKVIVIPKVMMKFNYYDYDGQDNYMGHRSVDLMTSYFLEKKYDRHESNTSRNNYGYNCWGYKSNGEPCKVKFVGSGFLRFHQNMVKESKLIKHIDPLGHTNMYGSYVATCQFKLCKNCEKKYSKNGNMFDEWATYEGYDINTNGYLIRTK